MVSPASAPVSSFQNARGRFPRPIAMLIMVAGAAILSLLAGNVVVAADAARRPNVVLIMTDDQGFGDFACQGNPVIRTPRMDRLAREGVELQNFYVSPVCTPTRASLMTGRYNYRTRAIDTFLGRAMMDPAEVTVAETLAAAGYRTGIFGKWHLGDNYPLRAMDQGFQESLVLFGGGLCQPADPPPGNSYFNPTLSHNGKLVKTQGYCSDVYTNAALDFIRKQGQQPFFVYLAFNCPHSPYQAPELDYQRYLEQDLRPERFPQRGIPAKGAPPDDTARAYSMITNIDDNLGRLLDKLDEWHLADNTLVIFLTDNGPPQPRFNGGLHGVKGMTYEGGIRVPCLVRGPGVKNGSGKLPAISAHIDLAPTILEACGVSPPQDIKLDGRSLWPQLTGHGKQDWPARTLFFQWHRGDQPDRYRAFAAREPRYKLVQPVGGKLNWKPADARFELYDIVADPYEMHDIAESNPQIVRRLKDAYDAWFDDVSASRGYAPPRIVLGSPHENPTLLTRQDRRGPRSNWTPEGAGHWDVDFAAGGNYEFTLLFDMLKAPATVTLRVGTAVVEQSVKAGERSCVLRGKDIAAGPSRVVPEVAVDGKTLSANYVDVRRLGDTSQNDSAGGK
jgi:arylsulfatase A-like enzyme